MIKYALLSVALASLMGGCSQPDTSVAEKQDLDADHTSTVSVDRETETSSDTDTGSALTSATDDGEDSVASEATAPASGSESTHVGVETPSPRQGDSGTATGREERPARDPQGFFSQRDANDDGKLAGDEMPFWMTGADADEDGAVTWQEFSDWSGRNQSGGFVGRGGGRVAAEGSGQAGSGDNRAGRLQTLFTEHDADDDGKLTGEELPGWMASADADEDGAVTLEEVDKWAEQYRSRGGGGFGGPRKREGAPERSNRPEFEDDLE